MSKQAIGIFDSGIGGLSTLKPLRQLLPNEDFIYVADMAFSPYGDKSQSILTQRADAICEFLIKQDVKAIVIACNTATAASIAELRQKLSLPIIGVEPGIKPASEQSLSGVAGILATGRTLSSAKFQTLLKQFSDKLTLLVQACPGLAEAIEEGELGVEKRATLIHQYAEPLLKQGADTLVLGCTHYPLIAQEISQLLGSQIRLIDTSEAIAKQVVVQLENRQTLNSSKMPGKTYFYYSTEGHPYQHQTQELNKLFSYYWGGEVTLEVLP
ncbi:MAG: glutamate racemase [Pseudohongiellaceae bacterium]|nr:glutamate racemase [Pseudohongiellaceae bacterium]